MQDIGVAVLNTLQGCRQTSSSPRRACSLKYRCLRPDGKRSRRLREAIYASHKLPVAAVKGGAFPEAESLGASCDFQPTGGYIGLFSLQTSPRGVTVWSTEPHAAGSLRACVRRRTRGPHGAPQVSAGAEGPLPSVTPCSSSSWETASVCL